jgi:ABC-type nitrate/sulfonate/bicarbonate transport system substrate-binding protein
VARRLSRPTCVALLLTALLGSLVGCSSPPARPGAGAPSASQAPSASGPSGAPAPTPPPLRDVRTSYPSAAASFAPLWAAYEYGLFEQHGLRPSEPVMISGGPANAQTLSARELEASYTAFSPMVGAIMGGAPIKVVMSFGRGFSFALFTRVGSGVASAQDMKGKRAGVSRIGSESYTVIRNWARANGLRDDDIGYVNAGTVAERLVAMEAGAIDLMPLDPPVVVVAEKRGFVLVADLTREPLPWQRESLTLPEEIIRNDSALATAITRAIAEAAYLIRADRQRFDAVVGKYIRQDDPDALGAAYRAALNGWIPRGRPDPADVHAVQESVDEEIPGTASQPFTRFVDLSVLDRLEQEGYFERLERQYPLPPGALPTR